MSDSFEELTAGLTAEQKADFFRTLHEAGISTKDRELALFFRGLQLYKAYYEEIPVSVQKGVAEMKQLKTEIEELAHSAEQSANAGEHLLDQVVRESAQIGENFSRLNSFVEGAMLKTSGIVAQRMTETLASATEKLLPVERLAEAGRQYKAAVAESNQASADLRNNIRIVRRAHLRAYLLAACSLIFVLWVYFHFKYERRVEQIREEIAARDKDNHDLLLALLRARNRLVLIPDTKNPKRKLLYMNDAEGWTTPDRQGVIAFKE